MKLFVYLARRRPSDGVWLLISLLALVLMVALPAAAWTRLDAAALGRPWPSLGLDRGG